MAELLFDKKGIKVFKGDNQEVLNNLKDNSINLIYCDILYNSGKTFDDYNDNLGTPQEAVQWYRPRLKEMHRILNATGSIYIHCNWRMDSYIRILLDEIFGFKHFRNRIYRKHSDTRGFVDNYDSQMDVILYYTKDKHNFTFNELTGSKLSIIPLFENGILEGRSSKISIEDFNFDPQQHNKHWLVPASKIAQLYNKKEIELIDGFPYRKTYSVPVGNLWDSIDMLDNYSRVDTAESYDTPKPPSVLKRIIEISSNVGDTVGDFFLGGGTTALETLKLGRKGIFCDISNKACTVSISKLESEMNKSKII